jgi:hypothetical protein
MQDTIKKDYQAVMSLFAQTIEILTANKVKKAVIEEVKAKYDEATFLTASKKSNGSGSNSTAYFDPQTKELVAVFCYYHKKWELVANIEYGKKAGTKTGLNTMCKEGTSAWTKNNRKLQKAKDELTQQLLQGKLTQEQFTAQYNDISFGIEPHSDEEHSFATLDELLAYVAGQAE